ncbi:VCBS repeat-containing protein [Streptomyces sp. NPDC089919]|uniref:FG-GAP repeat domain-containing protein n=1 Tax=Streptomyces sp. NPDC089919 TaxID=3155188 RepID=UPI00341DD7AD
MRRHTLLATAACTAATLALTGAATTAAGAAPAVRPLAKPLVTPTPEATADFNGDGYPDLAADAYAARVAGVEKAGVIAVRYGSPTGLGKASLIHRDTPGVPGLLAYHDEFGKLIGQGDVDGDGYDDLLVQSGDSGTPANPSGTMVLRGGKDGITGRYTTLLPWGNLTTGGAHLYGPQAVGDVTGDGIADLLAQAHDGKTTVLAVLVGPLDRATNEPASIVYRETTRLDDNRADRIRVGDMTGDGIADAVVFDYHKGTLYKGSRTGLVPVASIDGNHLTQTGDFGDLNKDGYQDFVAGTHFGTPGAPGGHITVTYGGPRGVSAELKPQTLNQDSPGVPDTSEKDDYWGRSVSIGDTDGDGYDDIAVGAPQETGTDPAATASGAVTVLRGGPAGVSGAGARQFTQETPGVPGTSQKDDRFGNSVALVDADRDGRAELYTGGQGDSRWAGRVWQLPAGADGITGTGAGSVGLADLGLKAAGGAVFGYRLLG